jgi:putative ABC transport system permease protein
MARGLGFWIDRLLRRERLERDMKEEMQFHVDQRAADLQRQGMPAEEARRRALIEFGGVAQYEEAGRQARSLALLHDFLQDLRYGARILRKTPGFSFAAVLVLALGIGGNTAIFSLVDAVLLRPLPFPHPEQLLRAKLLQHSNVEGYGAFGTADFLAWRDRQHSFEDVAATAGFNSDFSYSSSGQPLRINGVKVTRDFFNTLGVSMERGRAFQASDDNPGAPPVVVVSHDFWQNQLNGSPDAIGKSILLNGRAFTVVGVAPRGLRFPSDSGTPLEVWSLLTFEAPRGRPPYYLVAFGRLKPGVTVAQAETELTTIVRGVQEQFPRSPFDTGRFEALKEIFVTRVRPMLWVLLAAMTFVLLIAMVNIANMLLARGTARQRELGLRLALGASRNRVVRQLLTESILLAFLGGATGLLIAIAGVRAFVSFTPMTIPMSYQVSIDLRVLAFTGALTLVTGILFGLAPALHIGRAPVVLTLKEGAQTTTASAHQLLRRVLVVSEVALALMLMVSSALMIRSFARLQSVSPGFDPSHLLVAEISLPRVLYPKGTDVSTFWDRLMTEVNSAPGVKSAALSLSAPPNHLYLSNPFTVEGQSYDKSRPLQFAEELTISPKYFTTLGVPLISGRWFTAGDYGEKKPSLLVINRAMAERYFPDQDAVGKRIQTGDPDPTSPWETIIGVVGDVKYSGLDSDPTPQIYVPYTADGWAYFSTSMFLIVRTEGDPLSVVPEIRERLRSLDRNIPLANVRTMEDSMGESVGEQRFRTVLLGGFAAVALMLACFGLYAVVSYFVGQRTREIGIRVALGASRAEILKLVLSQAALLCAIGLACGVIGALSLTRALKALLFEISPTDPLSFAATATLLIAVALLAGYVPARRAARVDPMVALRYE